MEETAAIRTRKLSKVFGTRKAVDKVSIEVPQGAFLSIFGPNGAVRPRCCACCPR